jgi:acyl carrier protein
MKKEETTDKLKSVFQKVLEENDITITREMTAQDVEKWDSLRHIQLISEVERAFEIKLDSCDLGRSHKVIRGPRPAVWRITAQRAGQL